MALVERGVLAPLPTATYPADAVHDAYRAMLPGVHRGKLVVSFETSPRTIAPAEPLAPIRGDGSYLVTGGLGGLGLTVAAWLVERGPVVSYWPGGGRPMRRRVRGSRRSPRAVR